MISGSIFYLGNTAPLQAIKGIGAKTAQRLIIELRDKVGKEKQGAGDLFPIQNNRLKEEALSALVILGFNKGDADKVISKILVAESSLTLGRFDQESPETVLKALNNPNLVAGKVQHIILQQPLLKILLRSVLTILVSGTVIPVFTQVTQTLIGYNKTHLPISRRTKFPVFKFRRFLSPVPA